MMILVGWCAQILIAAIFSKVLQPAQWTTLPQFISSLTQVIDTNIPLWQWPRLLFAFLRPFLFGIDSQTITPEMITPFQTSQGAHTCLAPKGRRQGVLAPNWEQINPLLKYMFGR